MFAIDFGDVVSELDRRGHFVRRQQAVDSESGKSAIQSLLRDAQNAIRAWNIGQTICFWRIARGVEVVQASAGNVYQRGRKSMGIAKRALLRICRLRTLLETTAVGDTAENAGNELGVVHKAETEKETVLLAKVDVHPRVKRVAMFIELR